MKITVYSIKVNYFSYIIIPRQQHESGFGCHKFSEELMYLVFHEFACFIFQITGHKAFYSFTYFQNEFQMRAGFMFDLNTKLIKTTLSSAA